MAPPPKVAPGHLLTQAGETCEHTRVQLHSKTQGGLVQNPLLDQLREPVASVVDGALHRAERRPHSQLLLHPRRAHPRKAPHWRAKAPSQKSPPHPIGKVTGHYPPKVFLKRRRRWPPPSRPSARPPAHNNRRTLRTHHHSIACRIVSPCVSTGCRPAAAQVFFQASAN